MLRRMVKADIEDDLIRAIVEGHVSEEDWQSNPGVAIPMIATRIIHLEVWNISDIWFDDASDDLENPEDYLRDEWLNKKQPLYVLHEELEDLGETFVLPSKDQPELFEVSDG